MALALALSSILPDVQKWVIENVDLVEHVIA